LREAAFSTRIPSTAIEAHLRAAALDVGADSATSRRCHSAGNVQISMEVLTQILQSSTNQSPTNVVLHLFAAAMGRR
jgi:hypothetical protein